MDRIDRILNHTEYKSNLNKIIELEKERIYCRHNLQHFLDVARVAYIIALEKNLKVEKEMIYAAALLHDIGKWKQYTEGVDHADASAEMAAEILEDCLFSEEESIMILEAIKKHRGGKDLRTPLDHLLYEADKQSRLCIDCSSIKNCKRFNTGEKPLLLY